MRKLLLFIPATVILFTTCSQTIWEKTDDGVIIKLKAKSSDIPHQMKLEVVNDQIIHVIASPVKGFSEEKSLCVIDQDVPVPFFNVKQMQDSLIVSTAKIRAKVSLVTGQVIFCDEDGNVILKERPGEVNRLLL